MTSSDNVVLFDIETNGFLDQLDRLHCMSSATLEGDTVTLTVPSEGDDVRSMLAYFDTFDTIVAHNGIIFDLPALHKLYNWKPKAKVIDTLVLSSLLFPDIEGGHSLRAWGMRLKCFKGEYTGGFDEYSEDMGKYCVTDTVVLKALYKHLMAEFNKDADMWQTPMRIENKVAQLIGWQERNGWQFNSEKALGLIDSISQRIIDIDSELAHMLKWKVSPKGTGSSIKPFTATGKPSARCEDFRMECRMEGLAEPDVGGEFCRIAVELPDLGSRKQMIELLMQYGWKPTEYTDKGNPKFTEDSIVGKLGAQGQMLVERFVCITRRSQIGGWLEKVRPDGRIVAGAMPNATPTARMRHRTVVNVPRVGTPYGADLRALFTVPVGKVQVGADASGLELRLLAHYMGDAAYTDAVVNGKSSDGTDVHTVNCKILGLEPKKVYILGGRETTGRDIAKTFIYALLYGAGDEKLGSILDGGAKEGKKLRNKFLTGLPKYKILLEKVSKAANKGWLRGIDGRKIFIRHEHAALNSLLQSGGSICVKMAMCRWADVLIKKKVPFKLIGTFHDEVQAECAPQHADIVGDEFCKAMTWVSDYLKMRVTLAGEYKVGSSWYDCH